MTPEEREDLGTLLAGMAGDEPIYAWLKLQLEHSDWDNWIEHMGGGKTAHDAYMNPIFDGRCAVTAFDMHAQLTSDGRDRGLWVWLFDESRARAETYAQWAERALAKFCQITNISGETMGKFSASMAMDSFMNVANSKVNEAALLEWPAVKKLYAVIGKELEKRCPKPEKKKKKKKRPSASRTTSKRRRSAASSSKRR